MLQNVKTFCASPSTRFHQQQKLKNLFKFVPLDRSIDTRVLVLFQIYKLLLQKLRQKFQHSQTEKLHHELCSCYRQLHSEFCIALLVLKNILGYSVALCKVKQKKSINPLETVNIAQDIANELKCLREKAEYEFYQLYIFVQETAKVEDFILKTPRLTSKQTYPCNIAAVTDEEHFRLGIFILFLDNFIVTLEARFAAHKSIIGEFLLIQLVHQLLNKLKVFKFWENFTKMI